MKRGFPILYLTSPALDLNKRRLKIILVTGLVRKGRYRVYAFYFKLGVGVVAYQRIGLACSSPLETLTVSWLGYLFAPFTKDRRCFFFLRSERGSRSAQRRDVKRAIAEMAGARERRVFSFCGAAGHARDGAGREAASIPESEWTATFLKRRARRRPVKKKSNFLSEDWAADRR